MNVRHAAHRRISIVISLVPGVAGGPKPANDQPADDTPDGNRTMNTAVPSLLRSLSKLFGEVTHESTDCVQDIESLVLVIVQLNMHRSISPSVLYRS